ncbi:sulfotransferase [Rhizobium sp. LjRoot254]|uniref:sulfotransferase n=1 Tax=Rhizobium sp. LjRoot254 TaxID=3342297 RepID=UPI003F500541
MASMREDSWSVCATVNERADVLEAFVAHYRAMGAAEIFLFFDQPDRELMQALARDEGVKCLASIELPAIDGKRAPHEDRQKNNFRHAMAHLSSADWVGHVDADELLFPIGDQASFAQFLGGVDNKFKSVKISPAEAVFGPSDNMDQAWGATYARLPIRQKQAEKPAQVRPVPNRGLISSLVRRFRPGKVEQSKPKNLPTFPDRQVLIRDVYGPLARKFLQQGLAGHFSGKSFLRRGESFSDITLHRATPVNGEILNLEGAHFAIVHYDAMSYDDWVRKWWRRAEKQVNMVMMSDRRVAMLDEFRMYDGNAERQRQLFEALNVLDRRQLDLLAGEGLAYAIKGAGSSTPKLEVLAPGEVPVGWETGPSPEEFAKRSANRAWDKQYHRAVENADPAVIAAMRDSIAKSDFDQYRHAFARIGTDRFTDRRKLVEPSESTTIEDVIFIAGVHRSGTTLLESLIQARFDVRVLRAPVPENEGQFLQDVMRDEVAYGGPGMFAFFDQSRLSPVVDPTLAAQARARLLLQWDHWTLGDSATLLEKTPANIVRMPYLRSVFPNAKFIVLVRDPRAVVLSVKKWNPSPNELLFMNWCSAYATALNDLDDDCLFVRYEDLCDDPERELDRIGAFTSLAERSLPGMQQRRFEDVRNTNDSYIQSFRKLPSALKQRLVFRPWEIFGYDLEDAFEAPE